MKGESFKTWIFRQGMNLYPMFFGTGGKAKFIRHDWQHAIVELKLGLWTRNYVGTIFGGSMFSALDPFHIVLLINCLGKDYIVWDKSAEIQFKKPGKKRMRAEVRYEDEELQKIREITAREGRYEFVKSVDWIDSDGQVISTLNKTVYVATKEHFRKRQKEKELRNANSNTDSK